jgi:TetR/AcrR family transcriptional regulator, transcriptional repressor of aconitase
MPKRSTEHMAERRQEILEAAHQLFQKKGFHQTSVADICKAADLSVGALYTHFSNKREIMLALTGRAGATYLAGTFDTLGDFRKALTDKLNRGNEATNDLEMEFQLIAESVSDLEIRSAVKATIVRREELFTEILSSLKQRGLISKDYNPAHGARRINAIFLGAFTRNYFLNDDTNTLTTELIDAEFAFMH